MVGKWEALGSPGSLAKNIEAKQAVSNGAKRNARGANRKSKLMETAGFGSKLLEPVPEVAAAAVEGLSSLTG